MTKKTPFVPQNPPKSTQYGETAPKQRKNWAEETLNREEGLAKLRKWLEK